MNVIDISVTGRIKNKSAGPVNEMARVDTVQLLPQVVIIQAMQILAYLHVLQVSV